MRRCTLSVLLCLLAAAAAPARADTLDDLLAIAGTTLGEPALKDARPLIQCVLDKGPAPCAEMQVEAQANSAAKKFMPNDPLIKKAVAFIKAIYDEDWMEVIEVGGGAAVLAVCKIGLAGGGQLKEFLCKAAGSVADPVLKSVIKAVRNPTLGNLVNAIGALGDPDLVCGLVPDFPAKDTVCGPLGSVVKMAKDLANEAAKAGKEVGEFAGDVANTIVSAPGEAAEALCELATLCDDDDGKNKGPSYLSEASYYKYVLFPKIQDRVIAHWQKIDGGPALDSAAHAKCLVYYPYFQLKNAKSNFAQAVKGRCDRLAKRWGHEGDVMADTLASAAASYYTAAVLPQVPYNVVEEYKAGNAYKFANFMAAACTSNLETQFPMPKYTAPVATAWSTACDKIRLQAEQQWKKEKVWLDAIIKQLTAKSCSQPAAPGPNGLLLRCTTEADFKTCLTALSGGDEKKHCAMVGRITHEALTHDAGAIVTAGVGPPAGRTQEAETARVGRVDPRVTAGRGADVGPILEIVTARATVACTPAVSVTVIVTLAHGGAPLPAGAATLRIVDPARRNAVLATAAIPALAGARSAEVQATFALGSRDAARDRTLSVEVVSARGGTGVQRSALRTFVLSARQLTCRSGGR